MMSNLDLKVFNLKAARYSLVDKTSKVDDFRQNLRLIHINLLGIFTLAAIKHEFV
jgi:hypothetical protein